MTPRMILLSDYAGTDVGENSSIAYATVHASIGRTLVKGKLNATRNSKHAIIGAGGDSVELETALQWILERSQSDLPTTSGSVEIVHFANELMA